MRQLLRVVVLSFAFGSCSSSQNADESREIQCTELRDHLVDLRLQDGAGPGVDVEAHRVAMKQALGADFITSCKTKLSENQIKCGLEAQQSSSIGECAH